MRFALDDLPQARARLGDAVRGETLGEMTGGVLSFSAGTDLCPLLAGLDGDHCQCPHWGYVLEGQITVTYQDGTSETVSAGDIFYWPAGHVVKFDEDTRYVEFSPKAELDPVLDHVAEKMT